MPVGNILWLYPGLVLQSCRRWEFKLLIFIKKGGDVEVFRGKMASCLQRNVEENDKQMSSNINN